MDDVICEPPEDIPEDIPDDYPLKGWYRCDKCKCLCAHPDKDRDREGEKCNVPLRALDKSRPMTDDERCGGTLHQAVITDISK